MKDEIKEMIAYQRERTSHWWNCAFALGIAMLAQMFQGAEQQIPWKFDLLIFAIHIIVLSISIMQVSCLAETVNIVEGGRWKTNDHLFYRAAKR